MSTSDNAVVVVSAARTPVGSFNGALSPLPASELGTIALKAAMQRAGLEGKEIDEVIAHYLGNAKIICDGLDTLGISYSGGVNSPYIWFKTPGGLSSWDMFHKLLNECQVVGTPGAGFGKCGEGYFRLTGFGSRDNVKEAITRFSQLQL